jgi:hypothetical protein
MEWVAGSIYEGRLQSPRLSHDMSRPFEKRQGSIIWVLLDEVNLVVSSVSSAALSSLLVTGGILEDARPSVGGFEWPKKKVEFAVSDNIRYHALVLLGPS